MKGGTAEMNMLTDGTREVIEEYSMKFSEIHLAPEIIIPVAIILVIIFLIRLFIVYKIEKTKIKKKYDKKQAILYIGGHIVTELLLAFILSDVLIKLTNGNPKNYIINFIAAPSIASIISIYIDSKIIVPIETATGLGARILKKKESKSEDKSNGNITININNGSEPVEHKPDMSPPPDTESYLDQELADSDDFNIEVINAINGIKKVNASQNKIIGENTKKLDSTIESLQILKEAEMVNKKTELKKLIYQCLNQGYATTEQNEKVTLFFESYKALGGNHEIDSLYYNHYLKLSVHDDNVTGYAQILDTVYSNEESNRFAGNLPDINKRRLVEPKRHIYTYGELDGEANS